MAVEGHLPRLRTMISELQGDSDKPGSLRTGDVIGARVIGHGERAGSIQVQVQGQIMTIDVQANLPQNSLLVGQVLGQEPLEMKFFQGSEGARQLSSEQLTKTLQQQGLPTDSSTLDRARNQLRVLGYIMPDRLEGSDSGSRPTDQIINQLQSILGQELSNQEQSQLLNTLRQESNPSVRNLEVLQSVVGELTGAERSRANDLLQSLQNQLRMVPGRDARTPTSWLQALDLPETVANREVVEQLLDAGIQPDRERVQQLVQFRREGGTVPDNTEQLKQILSMKQQSQLQASDAIELLLTEATREETAQTTADSPMIDIPTDGDEVRQRLQSLGYDLMNRLRREDSVRLDRLLTLLQNQSTQQDGSDDDDGGFRRQVLRHLAASSLKEDEVFLFIPFQVNEETHFAQLRFRDEREEEGDGDPDRWSLTIELELTNLGRMRLHLRHRLPRLTLTVETEAARTAESFRQRRDDLIRELEQLGYEPVVQVSHQPDFEDRDMVSEALTDLPEPIRPSFEARA